MQIIDAQIHIWGPNVPERPWPARHAGHGPQLSADEALAAMDAAGVDAAILVPPSWEGERNDLVIDAMARYPHRFAAMGRLDPEDPELEAKLATWQSTRGLRGLRFSLHRPGLAESLAQGSMDNVWGPAQKYGIPIMVLVPQTQMHHFENVAARYPDLRLVMDHLGVPSSVAPEKRWDQLDALLKLARYPNVAVKVSALPCFALDEFPYRSLHPHIQRVIEVFGLRRVFWGSDLSRLPCSYRQCVEMFTEHMPFLSAGDLEWIMGRGLREWLGIDSL